MQCGVLNAVHALMGAEDLRENALDVLLVISAKKSKDAPAEVFGPFVLSLLSMCEAGLLNETEYAVHRRLCQAFKDIGCNHWYLPRVPFTRHPSPVSVTRIRTRTRTRTRHPDTGVSGTGGWWVDGKYVGGVGWAGQVEHLRWKDSKHVRRIGMYRQKRQV